MEKISITRIKERSEKIDIMKACDNAFPIRLFERENAEEIVDRIDRFALFYAAKKNDTSETVGYVAFYANDKETYTAYITSIGVLEEFRHENVGRGLIETVFSESMDRGMKRVRLEVLNANHNAIGFYKHMGFVFEESSKKTDKELTSYMVRGL